VNRVEQGAHPTINELCVGGGELAYVTDIGSADSGTHHCTYIHVALCICNVGSCMRMYVQTW
jgi:hypothetical protein